MSVIYTCVEPGSIPGIPGHFAACRVEICDDGEILTTPLAQHPFFEPAEAEGAPSLPLSLSLSEGETHPGQEQQETQDDDVSERRRRK